MARITLTIYEDERKALVKLAERERRRPQDQAAVLIKEGLKRAGLLSAPCEFCGATTTTKAYTSSIPPHKDVWCCDDCFKHEKGWFDGEHAN